MKTIADSRWSSCSGAGVGIPLFASTLTKTGSILLDSLTSRLARDRAPCGQDTLGGVGREQCPMGAQQQEWEGRGQDRSDSTEQKTDLVYSVTYFLG